MPGLEGCSHALEQIILIKQQSMRNAPRRIYQSRQLPPNSDTSMALIKDLQGTIETDTHLPHKSMCKCVLCIDDAFSLRKEVDSQKIKSTALEGAKSMKRILDGLTTSGAKSLKLYLPDIFFLQGDGLEIFQTNKEGRIIKLPGATPLKTLYPILVRLRREYKSHLQQSFNRFIFQKIQTSYMHAKYYDKIVPPSFHAGIESPLLQANKNHFKRYILHKNDKYEIASLQQHKMNEKQPFSLTMYKDGTCQLLNQVQFQLYTLQNQLKMSQEVMFVQSYIKYKKQTESIMYSQYTYDISELDFETDRRAELDVMILLGGISKYDEGYRDLQSLEELDFQLMLDQPKKYVQVMTYKIVHYLAMASRMYINRIKIKWIANDIGAVYLQEIMECITSEVPRRIIKFRLPRQEESLDFYNASGHFMDVYKDMKKRRALNTLIIKKDIDSKTYEELMEIMNPEMKSQFDQRQRLEKQHRKSFISEKTKDYSRLYQTIDVRTTPKDIPIFSHPKKTKQRNNSSTYEQHLKQHPELAMRNLRYGSVSVNRYSPEKSERVDTKINSHFRYHMSSEDKKILSNHSPKSRATRSGLEQYMQQKKGRIVNSVLYATFSDMSHQKMKDISSLLQHEKISKKLQQSSSK